MPRIGNTGFAGSQWVPRQVSCGRLLVDTFLTAKELVRETKYDLTHLCKVQLGKERLEFEDEMLPKFFMSSSKIQDICDHTENDCFMTYKLMFHLSVIPLTK